jgi:peptide/nickel transport system substrate-binding protein
MMLDFERGIADAYNVRQGQDVARLKPNMAAQDFLLYQFGPDDGDLFLALNMNLDAARKGQVKQYKVNWFRDRRFREAVSHAIDRMAQVKAIRRNLGYPEGAPQTLAPGPFRQDGFPPPNYDPEKAKALLDEMGLKLPPGEKYRKDAAGNEVGFTINTNSGNEMREQACEFIRTDLQKIGIKVNYLPLEFNLLVDKMDVSFDWEALVMGLTGSSEPHWGANIWKSDGRLHMWWPAQKTPSFPWEKQIDDIFLQGIQELDHAKRYQLYRKWVEIAWREQPFIYLTVPERVAALRNKFGNIFPGYVGDYPIDCLLNNEEEIFVK